MSFVETGQMSAVETGQMSAAETGQMSSAETRQMSTGQTGRCPVSPIYMCLVSTHNFDVSEVSTVAICQSHNAQVADRRSGPKSTKMARNGSRMVARS